MVIEGQAQFVEWGDGGVFERDTESPDCFFEDFLVFGTDGEDTVFFGMDTELMAGIQVIGWE